MKYNYMTMTFKSSDRELIEEALKKLNEEGYEHYETATYTHGPSMTEWVPMTMLFFRRPIHWWNKR